MTRKVWIILPIFVMCSSVLGANEIGFPASQVELHKGSIALSFGRLTNKLNIRLSGNDTVAVAGASYVSAVNNDVEVDAAASHVSAQILVNPSNGLYYWMRLGVVSYDLEIPSVTVRNKVSGQTPGLRIGIGARKLLFPDTLFSPAIAIDGSMVYQRQSMDSMITGSQAVTPIADILEVADFQVAFIISKTLKSFEPYGAVRVVRSYTTLKDTQNRSEVRGFKDNASIALGLRAKIYSSEYVVVEGSLGQEQGIVASWNIAF